MCEPGSALEPDAIEALLDRREQLRRTGQYDEADVLRRDLLLRGVAVEDEETSSGPRWSRLPVPLLSSRGSCLFWLRRKGDFCGDIILESREHFCAQHRASQKGRVPCPIDPKHTVPLTKLAGHLQVCQGNATNMQAERAPIPKGAGEGELDHLASSARRILTALWHAGALEVVEGRLESSGSPPTRDAEFDISIIADIAFPGCSGVSDESGQSAGSDASVDRLISSAAPWGRGAPRLRPRPLEVIVPECCSKMVSSARGSSCDRKVKNGHRHVLQQASIAGHLAKQGWIELQPNIRPQIGTGCSGDDQYPGKESPPGKLCLVELCAGSAHLSNLISRVSHETVAMHVLVDRQAVRGSADNALKSHHDGETYAAEQSGSSSSALSVRRIQCDIRDLELASALETAGGEPHPSGSDVGSFRVVAVGKHLCGAATDHSLRCCTRGARSGSSAQLDFRGFAFALCCHHVCEWSCYVGQEWLAARGITEEDFNSMRWFSKLAHSQYKQRQDSAKGFPKSVAARAAAARAEMGHLSKRLVDEGRVAWLREQGWDCKLLRFVDRETSPENALLLAWPSTQLRLQRQAAQRGNASQHEGVDGVGEDTSAEHVADGTVAAGTADAEGIAAPASKRARCEQP